MAHLCRNIDNFNSYELGVLDNDKNIVGVANGTAKTTRDGSFDLRISGSSMYLGKFHIDISKLGSKNDDWVFRFFAFVDDGAANEIGSITANISATSTSALSTTLTATNPTVNPTALPTRKLTAPIPLLIKIEPQVQIRIQGKELINVYSVLQITKPVSGPPENYDVIIRVNNSHKELISLSTTTAFHGSSSDSWIVKPSVAILRYNKNVFDSFNYAATLDMKRKQIMFKLSDYNVSGQVNLFFNSTWNLDPKNIYLKGEISVALFGLKLASMNLDFVAFVDSKNKRRFNLLMEDNLLTLPCKLFSLQISPFTNT